MSDIHLHVGKSEIATALSWAPAIGLLAIRTLAEDLPPRAAGLISDWLIIAVALAALVTAGARQAENRRRMRDSMIGDLREQWSRDECP